MKNDIINEGFDSFFDGLTQEMNPYRVGSINYDNWLKGYLSAKMGG